MMEWQPRHVGCRRTRRVNSNQRRADFPIRCHGGMHSFRNDQVELSQIKLAACQLNKAIGRNPQARYHHAQASGGAKTGCWAHVVSRRSAVTQARFIKYAVMQANYLKLGGEWLAVQCISLSSDR